MSGFVVHKLFGFRGIKLDDVYVVFEPSQIKSVTDNNGNFDGKQDKILHQDLTINRSSVNPVT